MPGGWEEDLRGLAELPYLLLLLVSKAGLLAGLLLSSGPVESGTQRFAGKVFLVEC